MEKAKKRVLRIESLLNKSFLCGFCKKKHFIPTRKMILQKGAIGLLPDFLSSLIKGKEVLVLSDDITYHVAGHKCVEVLKDKWKTSSLVLFPKNEKKVVYANEGYFSEIEKGLKGKDILITVGSGSLTDMGKYLADRQKIPWVSFPTAPSMNAYTSGVAAFLSKGVKVTLPAQPAIGVITDLEVISNAPLPLIKAGFADSLARSFANADWKISSLITGEGFCPLPYILTSQAEERYLNKARKIINREEKPIRFLMEGLNVGGFSMVIAGTSSPASGGEHLISHFLDMIAHQKTGKPFSYHGLQVGLATLISATIYERLKNLTPQEVNVAINKRKISYSTILGFYQKNGLEIEEEFWRKIANLKRLRQVLPSLWDKIKREAFSLALPSKRINKVLKDAECPISFKEIGVNRNLARQAILYSRYLRRRITILDIADELGFLEEIAEEFCL